MRWAKERNADVLIACGSIVRPADAVLAIEMVASYGMAVGAEVFGTCVWAGRFIQRWLDAGGGEPVPVYRKEVKLHLCGSLRAKDSNIRAAIIDRFGPSKDKAVGLKASPGPLYGMKADCWSALAVAITADEGLRSADRSV